MCASSLFAFSMAKKKTYRIGEVASMLELNNSALRFWETEFPSLAPLRTKKGQRLYTEDHVALLKQIKVLLYEQGLTIEGARKVLEKTSPKAAEGALQKDTPWVLVQEELQELVRILSYKPDFLAAQGKQRNTAKNSS